MLMKIMAKYKGEIIVIDIRLVMYRIMGCKFVNITSCKVD